MVGLGNPGKKYAGNRHNLGFMVIDELARRHQIGSFRSSFGGEVASGLISGQRATLLKPMEYMNLSGFAASRAVQYLGVEIDHVVVIHDEVDIDFGRIKLKAGGGHGGHNGVRSMIEQLGTNEFLRVRAGVGKPAGVSGAGPGDRRVASYLLSDFSASEAPTVRELVERSADATEAILARGIRTAMNEFNGGAGTKA